MSFSLGLFYVQNFPTLSGSLALQANGITLQCTSPWREFTFLTCCPIILVFWHRVATALLHWCSQLKQLPFLHKNFNFIFFLTILKKLHCINYTILLFSYMLSSEMTLKPDAILVFTLFFYHYLLFLFIKKFNEHYFTFFYSEVRFSRQCSMYSWVKLYLVIIPTSWKKQNRASLYFWSLLYGEKLPKTGRAKFSNSFCKTLAQLEELPFCDGRIILLAAPTFLHLNTLAHPAMETLVCYTAAFSVVMQH